MKSRKEALKVKTYSRSRHVGPTGKLVALRGAMSVVLAREGDGTSLNYVSKGSMDLSPVDGRGLGGSADIPNRRFLNLSPEL